MQPSGSFRRPALPGQVRVIEGSTGRLLGTYDQKENRTKMARLEGTGKDPLGRYGKGEIFDVPKYNPAEGDDVADRTINSAYQELLDKGYAKEVAPEDDPGRTPSQIAAAKIGVTSGGLTHPVDAKLADEIDELDAYAIVHTGDPKATDENGDLRTDSIREGQSEDRHQRGRSAAALGQPAPTDDDHEQASARPTAQRRPRGGSGGSGGGSGSSSSGGSGGSGSGSSS